MSYVRYVLDTLFHKSVVTSVLMKICHEDSSINRRVLVRKLTMSDKENQSYRKSGQRSRYMYLITDVPLWINLRISYRVQQDSLKGPEVGGVDVLMLRTDVLYVSIAIPVTVFCACVSVLIAYTSVGLIYNKLQANTYVI